MQSDGNNEERQPSDSQKQGFIYLHILGGGGGGGLWLLVLNYLDSLNFSKSSQAVNVYCPKSETLFLRCCILT